MKIIIQVCSIGRLVMHTHELAEVGLELADKLETLAKGFHVKSDAHDFLLWEAAIIKAKSEDLLLTCGVIDNLSASVLLTADHRSLVIQDLWIEKVHLFHTGYDLHQSLYKLQCLIDDALQGSYTPGEVVAKCMDMLIDADNKSELWRVIPEWVKQDIISRVSQSFEDEAFVSINSPFSDVVIIQRMKVLKNWLVVQGEVK